MRFKAHPQILWAAVLALLLAVGGPLRADEAAAEKGADDTAVAESKAEGKAEPAGDSDAGRSTGKRKSPGLAGGLAFFPGLIVHGSGHMYAGSWMKGLGLFAIEGAAIGIGVSTVNGAINDIQKLADGTKNGGVPTNVGTAYQALGVATVCTMAFLWTWFDDMAGAPIAANEYNRLADERDSRAQLEFTPAGDGVRLALVKNF